MFFLFLLIFQPQTGCCCIGDRRPQKYVNYNVETMRTQCETMQYSFNDSTSVTPTRTQALAILRNFDNGTAEDFLCLYWVRTRFWVWAIFCCYIVVPLLLPIVSRGHD